MAASKGSKNDVKAEKTKTKSETKKTSGTTAKKSGGAAAKVPAKKSTSKTANVTKGAKTASPSTKKTATTGTKKPAAAKKPASTKKSTAAQKELAATKETASKTSTPTKKTTVSKKAATSKADTSTKKAASAKKAAASKTTTENKTASKQTKKTTSAKTTTTKKTASAKKDSDATAKKPSAVKKTSPAKKTTTPKKETATEKKSATAKKGTVQSTTKKKADTKNAVEKKDAAISKTESNGKAEDSAPAQRKRSANDRKPGSKGQTKEEQEKKNREFNACRVKWFDEYMKGEMPSLYDMRISPDRDKLLTHEEQLRLAKLIQASIAAKFMSSHISKLAGEKGIHIPSTLLKFQDDVVEMLEKGGYPARIFRERKMRRKLERLIAQGDEARNLFAEKNLGLVTMVAGRRKKISNQAAAVDIDDLIAEGMNGLMNAIDHYNPDMGYKFSTNGVCWIEQPIRNYLDSKTKTIHMPAHMNSIYRNIHYAQKALRDIYPDDSYITYEKIAEYCQGNGYENVTVEKIEDAMLHRRETISYDAPFNENSSDDKSLVELMGSDEDISEDVLQDIGGKDNFNRMLALVDDDKKREILRDWYSSTDMHDLVILSNVSRKHCLTKERVRALKADAEKELFDKITAIAQDKGVGVSDAVMVKDSELEYGMMHPY